MFATNRLLMDVLICTAKDESAWCDAMRACLPEARVHVGLDAPSCEYAVVWKPPGELFERQRHLKALFSLGAGVNALLAMPSLPRDVPLVRMEDGGMATQMVEYALYVALRELRRFRSYETDQAQLRWSPQALRARHDYSIGVLGLGVLGGAVAGALAGFGFSVSGWSRTGTTIPLVRCESGMDGLDAVLAQSQLLMLFLPLTQETTLILDRARLSRLPKDAVVVNLSRGELIDDDALLDAVDSGHVAAAYLDVFGCEPLPPDHRFWRHPRVHITPHVAALTDVTLACRQVADKIRQLETGDAITGIVDRSRGY